MSFVSIEFALVALIFFPLYWGLRAHRRAQIFFLAASGYALYFTWSVDVVKMLFLFSLGVWLAGMWINSAAGDRKPRMRMAIGILLAVMVLLFYKYYEFIRQFTSDALEGVGMHSFLPVVDVVAPVGISFFTFQAISYLVWQGQEQSDSRNVSLVRVMLYLGFWPTHFAGPIFRAEEFFKQLDGDAVGAPIRVQRAVYIILLGLAQKMVFANWLDSTFVEEAFKYPDMQTGVTTLAAVLGYSLQIFLDFSGYTLIVTGLGLLLGFELPLNFRQPYMAASLKDFWQRWHISLSSFIRDYIYFPLGGNRKGYMRAQANTLAAMVISGLWHGANYTFLVWGALHGLGVVCQNIFRKLFSMELPGTFSHLLTLAYVGFAWIFFRSDSIESAWLLLGGLGRGFGHLTVQHLYLLAFTLVFFLCSRRSEAIERGMLELIERHRGWRLASAATCAVFLIILFGPSGVPGFIYYRF
ncbi:MAG TPA: MBOAT family O-acyltransferase [Gallionellaceae bacterium]